MENGGVPWHVAPLSPGKLTRIHMGVPHAACGFRVLSGLAPAVEGDSGGERPAHALQIDQLYFKKKMKEGVVKHTHP